MGVFEAELWRRRRKWRDAGRQGEMRRAIAVREREQARVIDRNFGGEHVRDDIGGEEGKEEENYGGEKGGWRERGRGK